MKRRQVIHRGNIPVTIPWSHFMVVFLMLERFHAPEWLWGIAAFLGTFIAIACLYGSFTEDEHRIDHLFINKP